jgi:hypothetical protein
MVSGARKRGHGHKINGVLARVKRLLPLVWRPGLEPQSIPFVMMTGGR